MVKLVHHVLFSRVLEQVNNQEMRDGESITRRRVQKKRGGGGVAANTSKAR